MVAVVQFGHHRRHHRPLAESVGNGLVQLQHPPRRLQSPNVPHPGAVDGGVFGCQGTGVAFKVLTTDGRTFETPEVTHQADGSISIIVDGDRKLRLAAHYWSVIEGATDDYDLSRSVY